MAAVIEPRDVPLREVPLNRLGAILDIARRAQPTRNRRDGVHRRARLLNREHWAMYSLPLGAANELTQCFTFHVCSANSD